MVIKKQREKKKGKYFIGTIGFLFLLIAGVLGNIIWSCNPTEIINASPQKINKAIWKFTKVPENGSEVYLFQRGGHEPEIYIRFSASSETIKKWLYENNFLSSKAISKYNTKNFDSPSWFDVESITNGRIFDRQLESRGETAYIDDAKNCVYFMVIYH